MVVPVEVGRGAVEWSTIEMLSSRRRRRSIAAMPSIPRASPPIRSQAPAVIPCPASVAFEACTGRSAIGTVGTAESAEEATPDAGGGVVEDSLAAAAAGAELVAAAWSFDVAAASFVFVSFSFAFARGVRDALWMDDDDDFEVVADSDCGGVWAFESGAATAGAGARAGASGMCVTCGAGAASDEDGG